ncbi:IMPACT family protein [Bartonella sp. LJL80]
MPFTLDAPFEATEEIKKSRFLTRIFPIVSEEDAEAILQEVRQEAATHHCYAWKYGQKYRFSDDGEPTGTAGKPILNAIEGRDCDRILVIVTRWYGGIQLGTGGLARAYGGGAARALQQCKLVELIDWETLDFHCPFHLIPILQNEIGNFQATIERQTFDAEGCQLTVRLPEFTANDFKLWLKDRSGGRIQL